MKNLCKISCVVVGLLSLTACSSMYDDGTPASLSSADSMINGGGQQTTTHGLGKQSAAFGADNPYNDSDAEPNTVYFAFNQYNIETDYNNIVAANARYLDENPQVKMRVEGNTDAIGSREYNVALGERRANSVAKALEARGVSPSQLTVVSYGQEHPAVLGQTRHANAMNRRVNLVYVS